MTKRTAEPDATNAFAARVLQDWGGAHIVALAYIGDRLGIFRALAEAGPVTSEGLADRTGLDERYVREWAAALSAGHYIEYDSSDQTFAMTPEQVMVLVDEGGASFLGGGFQYAQACVQQVPQLMDAFRNGGGVSFSAFGPEISEAIERLFSPGYQRDVASQWIPALKDVHQRVESGGLVAEVGCGGGQALVPVTEAYPASRFVGYDVDETSILRARERASKAGVSERVSFELTPAEQIPHVEHFDLVMAFNCIHDMVNPRGALAGIQRALRPDGALLWSEANVVSDRIEDNLNPQGRLLYGTSAMHCMTVSLAHGGEGLGNVVGEDTTRGMALEAGFEHFEKLPIENAFHQLFLARKGLPA